MRETTVDWQKLLRRFRKLDFVSLILLIVVVIVLVRNNTAPISSGNKVAVEEITLLSGEKFTFANQSNGTVLVFWATWCPPCKLELARIQRMIDAKKINASAVLAVSTLEEPSLVETAVRERKYSFRIAVDRDGRLAQLFNVSGTPAIYLVRPDQSVFWSTIGISPTLEVRISSFLKTQISGH